MPDRFADDVFLSHNAKDKPRVRRLAERLKQAGLRVWFDEWNVGPGDIALKVDYGLERSRVLLPPHAGESKTNDSRPTADGSTADQRTPDR